MFPFTTEFGLFCLHSDTLTHFLLYSSLSLSLFVFLLLRRLSSSVPPIVFMPLRVGAPFLHWGGRIFTCSFSFLFFFLPLLYVLPLLSRFFVRFLACVIFFPYGPNFDVWFVGETRKWIRVVGGKKKRHSRVSFPSPPISRLLFIYLFFTAFLKIYFLFVCSFSYLLIFINYAQSQIKDNVNLEACVAFK